MTQTKVRKVYKTLNQSLLLVLILVFISPLSQSQSQSQSQDYDFSTPEQLIGDDGRVLRSQIIINFMGGRDSAERKRRNQVFGWAAYNDAKLEYEGDLAKSLLKSMSKPSDPPDIESDDFLSLHYSERVTDAFHRSRYDVVRNTENHLIRVFQKMQIRDGLEPTENPELDFANFKASKNENEADLRRLELTDAELRALAKKMKEDGIERVLLHDNIDITNRGVFPVLRELGDQLTYIDLSITSSGKGVLKKLTEENKNLMAIDLPRGIDPSDLKHLKKLEHLEILNLRHNRRTISEIALLLRDHKPLKLEKLHMAVDTEERTELEVSLLLDDLEEFGQSVGVKVVQEMYLRHNRFNTYYDADTPEVRTGEGLGNAAGRDMDSRVFGTDTAEWIQNNVPEGVGKEFEKLCSMAATNLSAYMFLTSYEGKIDLIAPIKGKFFRVVAHAFTYRKEADGTINRYAIKDALENNNMGYFYEGDTKTDKNYEEIYNENKELFDFWINMDFKPVVEEYYRTLALHELKSTEDIFTCQQVSSGQN